MSKRRRNVIITLCILALALIVWLDHKTPRPIQSEPSRKQITTRDFEKFHEKFFAVIKTVDGDTLDLDIPDGKYPHTRVRLLGIDTPESVKPNSAVMYFGPQAAKFTEKMTTGRKVQVLLDSISPTRDKFGRLLAYLRLPDGKILNELLVRRGYAYADLRFPHGFYNKYSQLESSAKRENKGLWQNVTRRQLPQWLQRKKPNLLLER